MPLNSIEAPVISPNGPHLRLAATSTASPCKSCKHRRLGFCGVLGEDGTIRKKHGTTTARHNIPGANEVNQGTLVVCEGWAVRYFQLPNGKRQVLSVVLPGDLVSPASIFDQHKHAFSVQAVTDVRYCYLKSEDIQAKMASDPSVMTAWAQLAADENRSSDDHLIDLGQRSAQERIASLILRIMAKFEGRDEIQEMEFPFPLRQQHIADLTGLMPVHVCRVLSAFRKDGIFQIEGGTATISDLPALQSLAASV